MGRDVHFQVSKTFRSLGTHLCSDSVAMTRRIGNYQKLDIEQRLVANPMRLTSSDLNSLTGGQGKFFAADFNRKCSNQDIEKLG